ncbi:proliferating cell nuclear antigen [Tulasnella sp. JGI-2019a]|nr:proliferating cell nuclear antigen [Tulasnella sp. JGI-2019a]
MIEAKFESAHTIKKVLDAIKGLLAEVNFEANSDGFKLEAMDSSRVALVSVRFTPDSCVQFYCEHPTLLRFELAPLQEIIDWTADNDSITFRVNREDTTSLHVICEAQNVDRVAIYTLKDGDTDPVKIGIPDRQYDAVIKLPSDELSRIVQNMSQLSDSVLIEVNNIGLRFVSEGKKTRASILLKPSVGWKDEWNEGDENRVEESEPLGVTIEVKQSVSLRCSLEYLASFTKSSPLCRTAVLMMKRDMPLLVQYDFKVGKIEYYLAPLLANA